MKNRIPDFDISKVQEFFNQLISLGLLFHPDENPADILSGKTGELLFNEWECEKLIKIMYEMRSHNLDPCEFALKALKNIDGIGFINS